MAVQRRSAPRTTTLIQGLSHHHHNPTTSMHSVAACCWALLSWLSFISVLVTAQSDPESVVTSFNNLPARLFFFDDTDVRVLYPAIEMCAKFSIIFLKVALFHDSLHRNLYVSNDEGRSWKQADGIPDGVATIVVPHPFDNRFVNTFLYHFKFFFC